MRKRFCSHYTFCAPDSIFRQAVVELDESQLVTDILFTHSGIMAETAGTLFYDGIISRQPVSLKKRLTNREIAQLNRDFHYLDLSGDEPFHLIRETGTKPLLLDFGSDRVTTQTGFWTDFFIEFSDLTVFDVIAACAYYPFLVLGEVPVLKPGLKTELVVWQGIDWERKKLGDNFKIIHL